MARNDEELHERSRLGAAGVDLGKRAGALPSRARHEREWQVPPAARRRLVWSEQRVTKQAQKQRQMLMELFRTGLDAVGADECLVPLGTLELLQPMISRALQVDQECRSNLNLLVFEF
jgi:hypothetical protein